SLKMTTRPKVLRVHVQHAELRPIVARPARPAARNFRPHEACRDLLDRNHVAATTSRRSHFATTRNIAGRRDRASVRTGPADYTVHKPRRTERLDVQCPSWIQNRLIR